MATKKPENLSFEQALEELTVIVTDMEQGDLSLEQSLKQFERGIALANASSNKLQQAEQKVAILMGNDPQSALSNFNNNME
ncbi:MULTISPECIES: exodeoxyribonuclease VII small subunit [unclassified Pseudoalteromonas]|uniref:exodeoxyribonuclease VII small subunit n=1 Tax=unclassified Pseudoalteromonas TaxID=194690 RepID=UPI0025B28F1C|nr:MULTISPECIES: exodeoxyribonuclease VII small subunit [unclassified Pseudoalteromonas]MDN3378984.1 exodeoxyribonuclease VII small subunit [Pseudoalteromonas sp. APC 3893]MDN3387630.1 exodeoxyribonuclease VII small subunit [Pseudoalteromonas sp. APC 4017]